MLLDDDAGGVEPTVSIAGASTNESLNNFDANYLGFAVTLSEAATEEVRVDYRLLSGTGQAGAEGDARVDIYEQVVFAPGETSKTILIRTDGDTLVELDEAVDGPAPGQALVLYAGDTVLGGGVIGGRNSHDQGATTHE